METNTIDQQSAGSPESNLMSAIRGGQDMSQFKDESSSLESLSSNTEPSTLNTTGDRATPDASEQVNPTSSQPAKEGVTDKVATNPTDTLKTPDPKPRAPARIQELIDQNKAKDARIADLERQSQESKSKDPAKPEYLIPQPTPPQYTKEVLAQLLQRAKQDGDQKLFDNVQEQMEEWRAHELKMIEWKIDHKEEVNRHNSNVEFFKGKALEKWKTLSDPNSEHTKQYMGVRVWIQKEVPEALKKPVSEYFLAQVSDWKMTAESASAKLVAMESELKKAKDEVARLTKGSMPLDSKTRTESTGNNESPDNTLKDAKSNLMDSLRKANLGFGAQTM